MYVHVEVSKVHHYETTAFLHRVDMCHGIAQTSPTASDKVKLTCFKLHGTKVTCYLHYLGLDQDCKPNGSITLTAILQLPKKKGRHLQQDYTQFMARMTVSIYEGSIKETHIINEPRCSSRELDDEDRRRLTMHMTVHDVVKQNAIVFSKTCPDKVYFKIQTEIGVN